MTENELRTSNRHGLERRRLWLVLILAAVPFVCLAIPLYVIRPFRPQEAWQLAVALRVRVFGPWISAIATSAALVVTSGNWTRFTRALSKAVLATACILACAGTWLTTVNIFEKMFHPYDGAPAFTGAQSALVDPDDKVLAVTISGAARAYPIRTMGYHHIVNDTVGGTPLAITYCTLCHTGLVWSRVLDGKTLHFRLAGINNGNALLRDEETGSIWQQSTGEAIFGPYKGRHLTLLHSDELTFALWRAEQPAGLVLKPDPQFQAEYDPKDWERHVEKTHTVIDTAKSGISPHELMLGVTQAGKSKAYPVRAVLTEKLIQDRVGEMPLLILVGPDGASIRTFKGSLGSPPMTFTLSPAPSGTSEDIMRDAETGSSWNFRGCASSGSLQGQCLQPLDSNKDYWFDWLNHHPETQRFRG